jgi:hypothetical protein
MNLLKNCPYPGICQSISVGSNKELSQYFIKLTTFKMFLPFATDRLTIATLHYNKEVNSRRICVRSLFCFLLKRFLFDIGSKYLITVQ